MKIWSQSVSEWQTRQFAILIIIFLLKRVDDELSLLMWARAGQLIKSCVVEEGEPKSHCGRLISVELTDCNASLGWFSYWAWLQ